MKFKYCPCCAGELEIRLLENVDRLVCRSCGFIFYQNPTPAVAVVLLKRDTILLVKRKYPPRDGYWSLPAGFIECHETAEETAIREIKEETNLDIELDGLYGVFSANGHRDYPILLVVYRGIILPGAEIRAGDDALEARLFALNQLPEDIAFATHRRILTELQDETRVRDGVEA